MNVRWKNVRENTNFNFICKSSELERKKLIKKWRKLKKVFLMTEMFCYYSLPAIRRRTDLKIKNKLPIILNIRLAQFCE